MLCEGLRRRLADVGNSKCEQEAWQRRLAAGIECRDQGGVFRVERSTPEAAGRITTGLWPGFPSDLVSLVTVLATQAEGRTLVHDWMYELRLFALEQLSGWARKNHTLFKLVRYRPKWGIDFSMDYVDGEGNAMELLHYEFDSFDFDEIQQLQLTLEPILCSMDWKDAARELIKRKSEWHGLDFFAQSDWKCAFFGLSPERFKMVAWE